MPWTTLPSGSELHRDAASAFFHDSFQAQYHGEESTALVLAAKLAQSTPSWFEWLMDLRNSAVSLVGLKDVGRFGAVDLSKIDAYEVGDRFGIFAIRSIRPEEVVLEEDDKHLRVRLSVHLTPGKPQQVTVTTMVHVHNALGYVYMAFVAPVHKLITPPFVRKIEQMP